MVTRQRQGTEALHGGTPDEELSMMVNRSDDKDKGRIVIVDLILNEWINGSNGSRNYDRENSATVQSVTGNNQGRCVNFGGLYSWVMSGPLLFYGGFNEIVHVEERKGATTVPQSGKEFRNWIQDMQLVDLALTDREFTWFRGRSCSHIDRALVNVEWLEAFPETWLRGGQGNCQIIAPIILEDKTLRGGPRPFRSLDSWFTHDGFLSMVKEEWRGLGEIQFTDKLKMDSKITKFEEEIKRVDDMVSNGVYDTTMEARRKVLVTCCERWYVRKEMHWKQMSRSRHAKEMDKNTRYFHNMASARRWNNKIDTLVINGRTVRNQARIKIAIREFYKELYHQEATPMMGFRDGLVGKIDEDDVVTLERMPSAEEIREAVWDCESSKVPGCDGTT
ncbi:uncharacterized protein LOC107647623 [Arachis ipaensis]|uniref:uncharacterized protein LOC107647623 n=1 Tax=Arachis ipaensis TaxID=130454 RepID=UPI0007AFAB1F|nr:uncharacterized protein LOC107647623 [Arachis ipaensis]